VLVQELAALKQRNIKPKYYLHHPTVQNPTRHDHLPEDAGARCSSLQLNMACRSSRTTAYADLIWNGTAAAGDPCDERQQQRHPRRLVLEVDRARVARRLHRGAPGLSSRARSGAQRPTAAPVRSSRW